MLLLPVSLAAAAPSAASPAAGAAPAQQAAGPAGAALVPPPQQPQPEALLFVRPGPDDPAAGVYGSVGAALDAAPAGAVVRVSRGYYPERLLLARPVTVEADPPGAVVTVEHSTESPYESTVQASAPGCCLQGVTIRHSSPSIAANYAVLVRPGGSLRLERCDVRSDTGSGLGVEGGAAVAVGSRFCGNSRHGAALFGDLMGGGDDGGGAAGPATVLEACELSDNRGHGVLLRDGASGDLRSCGVARNGAAGVRVVDSALALVGCTVAGNRGGSVVLERVTQLDMEANALDAPPTADKL